MKKERFEKAKPWIQVGITTIVEFFTSAVTNAVLDHTDGNKISRWGAKAGGAMVGLVIGDRVSEYVCDQVETFMDTLEEIKDTIDETKEE